MSALLVAAALTAAQLVAASPRPAVPPAAESPDAHGLAFLARLQADSGSPGASGAVASGGRIVFSGGVGHSDLEAGTPQTGRSVHNIGSVSKTLAVVAVLQLAAAGKVDLDAPIQKYAPWFPEKQAPISVRSVLTHTSGIRHYKAGEFGPGEVMKYRHYDSFEESTRYWRDEPLLFAPGAAWHYSSYASNLMHAIVEAAGERPFEAYLARNVWQPAGMLATQFDVPSRIVPGRGRGYERDAKTGQLVHADDENVSYKYAGGGMLSTDEDLVRFAGALNAGLLLGRASLDEMYRLQLPRAIPRFEPAQGAEAPGEAQALVWRVWRDAAGRRVVGHSGGVKGTSTMLVSYPDEDVAVALHLNYNEAVGLRDAAQALAQIFLPPRKGGAR